MCPTGDEDASSYETWLGRDAKSGPHGHSGGDHFANFIDCVSSRKKEDLNAPIEEGHVSAAMVHLANASYRLGRTLRFDPDAERVIDDDEANSLLRDGDHRYRVPFAVPEEVRFDLHERRWPSAPHVGARFDRCALPEGIIGLPGVKSIVWLSSGRSARFRGSG
ncbi:MAG TPA: hypothetical protein VG206_12250 [Terriglobia bacterium]|nr:hypothetical protein [Terriglobia bacterium]